MATPQTTIGFDSTGSAIVSLYREAVDVIAEAIAGGERTFHAVYPHGADRTRTVAELIRKTRVKTIVITPNTARLSYWMNKRGPNAMLQEAALEVWPNSPVHQISANPFSCAPVLALIYGHLTPGKTKEQQQEAIQRFAIHAERQGYKLVIVDECTELAGEWSQYLLSFVKNADASIAGFSAARIDAGDSGWAKVFSDARRIRITSSAAALQGCITPYRHFFYLQYCRLPEAQNEDRSQNEERSPEVDRPQNEDRPPQGNPLEQIQSAEKISAAMQILTRDFQLHAANVRLLMLMDPKALTHVRSDGLLDAVTCIRKIKEQPVQSLVRPAILTGAAIVTQTSRQLEFMAAVSRHAQIREWDISFQLRSNDEFTEVSATGKDWNSATYIDLILALLREGLINCALCSNELLSWGLSRAPFNTVIDITSCKSMLYVNAPGEPAQVSDKETGMLVHYWDIIALTENRSDSPDLLRVLAKHADTEFPADDGFIEIGMNEIPALRLAQANDSLRDVCERHNAEQLRLANERKSMASVWKRLSISGHIAESIDVFPLDRFPERIVLERTMRDTLKVDAQRYLQQKAAMKMHHTLWSVTAISLTLSAFLVFPMSTGLYCAAGILGFLVFKIGQKWWSVRGARPRILATSTTDFFTRVAQAVGQALANAVEGNGSETGQSIAVSRKEDGTCRIIGAFRMQAAEDAFLKTMQELHAGGSDSGYLLVCDRLEIANKHLKTILESEDFESFYSPEYYLPVPPYFSQSRAHAEVFRTAWEDWIGKARLVQYSELPGSAPSFAGTFPVQVSTSRCVV